MARTSRQQVEIFIPGAPLRASVSTVKEHLDHRTWYHGHEPIDANRIVIPHGPGYDQIAAVICKELIDAGVAEDREGAFTACEGLIAVALDPLVRQDDAVLGLLGELYALEALVSRATDDHVVTVLDGWQGWKPSLRDFELGRVGVEVKATRRPDSQHRLQGLHQAEPTVVDGVKEQLFLLSLGLEAADEDTEGSINLQDMVRRIEEQLAERGLAAEHIEGFRTHVRDYLRGLDPTSSHRPAWSAPHVVRFARLYDMNDEKVQEGVLRSSQVSSSSFVVQSSITYTMNLPPRVSGDLNPTDGPNQFAQRLLRAALG
ncbi:PD-(D/E)XK motif protein [Desertihabitans brevis]|uniref:PD-(D/E)XK motif protein n=1 Tax=Desertihabitans brevis TaxID=2268447 RepID=UPI001314A5C3|nr:PD-(D/E)XK motif protein [Desertihabitans brevis]